MADMGDDERNIEQSEEEQGELLSSDNEKEIPHNSPRIKFQINNSRSRSHTPERTFTDYKTNKKRKFGRFNRHRNQDEGKNRPWENKWPPAQMFRIVDEEIKKYSARNDKTKLYNLFRRLADIDQQLKHISSSDDLKYQFGSEDAARLMMFYIATNGTLRSRVNELKKRCSFQEPHENNDIL